MHCHNAFTVEQRPAVTDLAQGCARPGKSRKNLAQLPLQLRQGCWLYPCADIKGNKETGRGIYIEDALFKRVYEKADVDLKDAMDLAYRTAQRVTNTRILDELDVRDGQVWVLHGKTTAKRRIELPES